MNTALKVKPFDPGDWKSKDELDKITVELRGATGIQKIPLSRFIFKTEDPVDRRDNGWKVFWTTVLIMIIVLAIALTVVHVVRRQKTSQGGRLSQSELKNIEGDKTVYSIVDDPEYDQQLNKKRE